jgi:hypothetical protein
MRDATVQPLPTTAAQEPSPPAPTLARPAPPAKPAPPVPALPEHADVGQFEKALAQRIARLAPAGALQCSLQASLEVARKTLVACGAAGVWVVELGALGGDRLLERRRVDGRAVGLFSRGGRVWVEVESLSAHPFDWESAGAPSVESAPHAEPALEVPTPLAPRPATPPSGSRSHPIEVDIIGRVVSSRGGSLVVDLGRRQGVSVGNRIELSIQRESPLGHFGDREVLAVGRVVSVSDEQSLIEVGVGEAVPVDAEARLTSRDATGSRSAPPRVHGLWTLAGVVRPFFVLDQLGFGALSELAMGYQTEGPLRVQLLSSPLAFSTADDGSALSATAVGLVSYDTRLFEIGLGLGAQTVNDGDYRPGSGLTVSQSLRFGALDGLNLSIRNDISLFHSEFDYSAFNGAAQVPVTDRGWLVLQGGGGSVGYAFFEAGGKVLWLGNGTRGSVFLRGTIGYATVYRNASSFDVSLDTGFVDGDDVDHAGPLVGFGVEWRM